MLTCLKYRRLKNFQKLNKFLISPSHTVFINVRDELITLQSWQLFGKYFPNSFLNSLPTFLEAKPQALLWTLFESQLVLQPSLLPRLYAGLRLGRTELWSAVAQLMLSWDAGRDLWKLFQVSWQNVLPPAPHSGVHVQVASSLKPGGICEWRASSFLWEVFSLPVFNRATIHSS